MVYLSQLKQLRLANNKLTLLPQELVDRLISLEEIDIRSNPIVRPTNLWARKGLSIIESE